MLIFSEHILLYIQHFLYDMIWKFTYVFIQISLRSADKS
jgi:hypothetical protein